MSELIERLKIIRMMRTIQQFPAYVKDLNETIEALSSVMPDDVAAAIKEQRDPFNTDSTEVGLNWKGEKAADLLERQEREIEELKWNYEAACNAHDARTKENEELEEELGGWKAHVELAGEKIEQLQARLDYIGNPQNGSADLAAYARGRDGSA